MKARRFLASPSQPPAVGFRAHTSNPRYVTGKQGKKNNGQPTGVLQRTVYSTQLVSPALFNSPRRHGIRHETGTTPWLRRREITRPRSQALPQAANCQAISKGTPLTNSQQQRAPHKQATASQQATHSQRIKQPTLCARSQM